ncbi:GNAT family N-acetyltransferase [Maricaulis sp. CAU 1757]
MTGLVTGLVRVGPAAAAELAALHAECFERPWPAGEFASLLHLPGTAGFRLGAPGSAIGMALTRQALDEAEILTIGVVPRARRKGAGRELLGAVQERLFADGVSRLFLEVSTRNAAADRLYRGAGFCEVGCRKGYYADGSDALVLEKWLSGDGQGPG